MYRTLFARALKQKTLLVGGAFLGLCGWAAISGPQGLQVLLEKHREIRELTEKNAALEAENARRRARIQRLEGSLSEQEMEIRRQLKLLRPGETTFILPEDEAADPEQPAAPPE